MSKQVRFTQLVQKAGKPHAASLWVDDPRKDPNFKKAIEENRIVSVQLVNVGTKKESGEIGFVKGQGFTYLIFPKDLPMAAGTKVIGLKFDQLEEAPVRDPAEITEAPRTKKVQKVKSVSEEKEPEPEPEPPKASPKKEEPLTKFCVTVELKAVVKQEIQVEARTAAEAMELAVKKADAPKKPDWETEALEVRRISES